MSTTSEKPTQIHHGRNIKRFREMLGIKQEALALELGEDWSQRRISLLEAKDTIEDDILAQVAAILKVPVEAIKNFDEQAAVTYFNTFNDTSVNHGPFMGNYGIYNFNPIEKWLEVIEENKKLYERLLESEREKIEILKNKG
ncbi:transcriptional regulator with XRE-family HTH domain [Mucilaginibacter sp. SG538B]|uniref:helix-turn-helix transcriptional regulator n=1 Tax=Mucilaginibacter sp. SG538B TaxID=2587021 RepID=UPI00159E9E09|nr:helix-turn-helix transcriptional regulator [Mucilaginibacter sp. SG538B]NVM64194.1 transcriptional regulator with XRE-family HTH domain [Mucilaginibacter sp. SG538B]NVM64233.1 transcriptional regulator with XRE-family HTH domain [Mucilaginibacter sp. SG538B]